MLVPDDFFDKVVENDKQFLDYLTTIIAGKGSKGLEVLTTLQVIFDYLHSFILKGYNHCIDERISA